jgi:hypothetical protein
MVQREWFCCSGLVRQTHTGTGHELGSVSEMYVFGGHIGDTIEIYGERNVIQEINGDCTVARVTLPIEEAVSSLPQAVRFQTEDGY